ncbi:MAG: TonB-dependent receptor [Bacteroidetes bacterium]|nr:TonB-dependent receptor [Bacteroidota bacterium]
MKLILFTLLSLTSLFAAAQTKYTVSGYVKDAETGEALIGARVFVPALSVGAIANTYGFYSLTLPQGVHEVVFSFVGKEPSKMQVTLDANVSLNLELKPAGMLSEVLVTGEVKQHESTEMSTTELPMSKVKSLPVLLGEIDVIKTAQLLPGIKAGSEGSSGIYVRGGGPDQNLILLDGVPIYNANHLFGFFSVFNADAINNVKIVKGGFPAEYGGRISSVIDIRMKEGDMKKLHGEGSVGIISSKLMLNGPIIKDKTSFMISARRTYIDLLAKPFIKLANAKNTGNDKVTGGYYFYDVNAKINHIINDKNRIYFSAYLGDDKFYVNSTYDYVDNAKTYYEESNGGLSWGNKIMALRWNHQFSPKLFANTTLNFSDYRFKTGFGMTVYEDGKKDTPDQNYSFDYLSGITDWGGNVHFSYYPNPNHKVEFGVGEIYHTFKPGVNQFKYDNNGATTDTVFGGKRTYAHEFYGFIQDDFKISKRIMANLGVHFSNFIVRDKYYNALQPRAAFNFLLDEKSSLKVSYSHMAQYLHLLTNTTIGLPTDLWVPATDTIPFQIGDQYAVGYTRELKAGYRIGAEAYYKQMNNLIEYKEGASFFDTSNDWEKLVEVGKGYSYGLEVLFEKRTGKTTGWIGYTLSWTNRQFDNLNNGNIFPYRYDSRHNISVVVTHKFNDKIDIGVVWVYATGNAVTLALQQYNALEDQNYFSSTVEHVDGRNNYRMPSYHRLDIGVNIHKEKKWGQATWSFGLYNAYNRQNPFYLEFGYLKNSDKKVLKQVSLFPIIPSINYSFKF